MNIETARKRLEAIRVGLQNDLIEFERETGASVTSVDLQKSQKVSSHGSELVGVRIEVTL